MSTKPKPIPEDIPADETGDVPEAPPPPPDEETEAPPTASQFKRSPMEDPAHSHHHLRDA